MQLRRGVAWIWSDEASGLANSFRTPPPPASPVSITWGGLRCAAARLAGAEPVLMEDKQTREEEGK